MPFIFWGGRVSVWVFGELGYGEEDEREEGGGDKRIGKGKATYNIDQDIQRPTLPFPDQLRGVIVRPLRSIVQVPLESLLAPRAIGGIGDGRVGRDRLIFPWVLQELPPCQSQSQSRCAAYSHVEGWISE